MELTEGGSWFGCEEGDGVLWWLVRGETSAAFAALAAATARVPPAMTASVIRPADVVIFIRFSLAPAVIRRLSATSA
jgi:hypothetical protein